VSPRGLSARRTDALGAGTSGRTSNPAPLSARQLRVLLRATTRELAWALRAVARETRAWQSLARGIPDAEIRRDALSSLGDKRGHTDGAALFSILPRARNPSLLRLLVAYEIAWDFLDSVNEHGAHRGQANGRQLHMALVEALDREAPISDHYRHHPWRGDGGYLRALVEAGRGGCEVLPAFDRVRPFVAREARRALVLGINHELDPARRDADLRAWAIREFASEQHAAWFELSGAASASLTIHALLTLAAERGSSREEIEQTRNAYFPWISAATTMLDSFVDQTQDAASGDHSYVAHYPSPELAVRRIRQLVERSLREAHALPDGEQHTLIAACMVAMYLSKDSTRGGALKAASRDLAGSGGSLTRLLLPILRLWRIAYAQRST
jgi:tetraprenyl-beta-curcumene synthase